MSPQTQAILSAVVRALDAKAPTHPYYIRQPMLAVAETITQNLKETSNGNNHHIRRSHDGLVRP